MVHQEILGTVRTVIVLCLGIPPARAEAFAVATFTALAGVMVMLACSVATEALHALRFLSANLFIPRAGAIHALRIIGIISMMTVRGMTANAIFHATIPSPAGVPA